MHACFFIFKFVITFNISFGIKLCKFADNKNPNNKNCNDMKNCNNFKTNFLFLILFLCILPMALRADGNKQKIKSIDITMDMPTANMMLEKGEQLAMKAAQTTYGDLFKSGVIKITSISWDGEFGDDKDGYPFFKAGFPYIATMSIMIDPNSKYITDYIKVDGETIIDGDHLKITVNGKPAEVYQSAPYFPSIGVAFTVPGGKPGPQKKEFNDMDYANTIKDQRSTLPYISWTEADELNPAKHLRDVYVVDEVKFRYDDIGLPLVTSSGQTYERHQSLFLSKAIIDVSNHNMPYGLTLSPLTEEIGHLFSTVFNLKEVWLSDKVDAAKYVKDLDVTMTDPLFDYAREFDHQSTKLYSGLGTLYIPESQATAVLERLKTIPQAPVYSIRTYKGDVYAAQKAGKSATQPLQCKQHRFTAKFETADRVCQYRNCKRVQTYYYSCAVCGKCERNKAHTFHDKNERITHDIRENIASDQAYIGVNTAGEHLYWKSCTYCGISNSYWMKHLTPYDQKTMGMDGSFEQYKVAMAQSLKSQEAQMLLSTVNPSDETFVMPLKSEAKMSIWAQDGVNRALCDHLVDDNLLGNDYTQGVNRKQLASIARLLVKEMTGKEATDDAIGLNDAALPKTGTVSRQEMATYIYRAMRYIEQHSDLEYSTYESHLSKYTDQGQIQPWAKEAMAFTNALEIIDPATATTLAPGSQCSIELALVSAERATWAHRTGWVQVVAIGELDNFLNAVGERNHYTSNSSFGNSDRMWVFRTRMGLDKWMPTTEPITGERCSIDAGVVHPIRSKCGKDYRAKEKAKAKKNTKAKVKEALSDKSGKSGKKSKAANAIKKGIGGLLNILN